MGMMNRKELAKLKPGQRPKPRTDTGSESLTKQEFAKETDINYIMSRYRGDVRALGLMAPNQVFADVSRIGSFGEVLQQVQDAKDAFAALPAGLRSRFENDPVQLIEFLQDEKNRPEAETLGLVPKKVEPVQAAPKEAAPAAVTPKA